MGYRDTSESLTSAYPSHLKSTGSNIQTKPLLAIYFIVTLFSGYRKLNMYLPKLPCPWAPLYYTYLWLLDLEPLHSWIYKMIVVILDIHMI